MRKILVVLAVAISAALPLGVTASASAGVLDQQQLVGTMDTYIDSGQSLSQTFTAALNGNLDGVDLLLRVLNSPTLPVTVEIRNVTAASPGGTVLASQSVQPSGLTGTYALVSITFAAPASVAAGTQYAIVTYSATAPPTEYSWARSSSDVYAGGRALYVSASPPPGTWVDDGGSDHVFQTYVAAPPTSPVTPGGTLPNPEKVLCAGRPSTQLGSNNADTLIGTPGPDVISGAGGNDQISGLAGNDLICGGPGKDTLKGGAGNDKLLGQGGKDTLKGGGAKDVCKGGKGNDSGKCEVEKSV